MNPGALVGPIPLPPKRNPACLPPLAVEPPLLLHSKKNQKNPKFKFLIPSPFKLIPLSISISISMTSLLSLLSESQSSIEFSEESEPSSPTTPTLTSTPTPVRLHRSLAVLSGHVSSVSCLALCGEFLLSASTSDDIIVWQQPHLHPFTRFGHPDPDGTAGFVKSLVAVGNLVFSAHHDARIRVWKLSSSSRAAENDNNDNIFKLIATLPTKKDYWAKFKFLKYTNYIKSTPRKSTPRRLWIQHTDAISCLAVNNGLIFSGSWDHTLKIWRVSDLKCLQSIKAHDDAINALYANDGLVYSASADGKIKVWGKSSSGLDSDSDWDPHWLMGCLDGPPHAQSVCWNAVIVSERGRMVYGGGSDGALVGWKRDEKEGNWGMVFNVMAHESSVLCLCSTGEFVCTGSGDMSIGVWRRETGENGCSGGGGRLCRIGVIRGHEAPVKCLQAAEIGIGGGFMLYSGGIDKSLRVWWVPKEYGESEEGEGQGLEKCTLRY